MSVAKTAERNAETEQAPGSALFDKLYPNCRGNPFFGGHKPTPAQLAFLGLHVTKGNNREVFQALYGGAAGGGKSDALLMAAAQYAWREPDFAAVLFRRSFTDLTSPGALLDRAQGWWIPAGVTWQATKATFLFPSGAKVAFAYLSQHNDHLKYAGAEYQLSCWDELTQWPDQRPYEFVGLSRIRRKADSRHIPLRTLSASNPGGPGHNWVMRKFVGGTDPETGEPIQPEHPYVPARIMDNPFLDRDAYCRSLAHLHPTVMEQLLNGDWQARDQGDYFRAEWFGELIDPEHRWARTDCIRIRWWDLAASEAVHASKTAGVLMARHNHGVRAIEHCRSGRWVPGKRDDVIVQTAQADGKVVVVGIEIEGGSGGVAQFLSLERRLRALGHKVVGARPRTLTSDREQDLIIRQTANLSAKTGRADPVAACLYRGYLRRGEAPATAENERSPYWQRDVGTIERDGIRLVAGPWTQAYLDAVEGFPPESGKEGVDEVDATSGAWAWLEAHPPRVRQPTAATRRDMGEQHDTHPEDRVERPTGRGRYGRWDP